MGLSDAYSALRSHFLSLDPFPSISRIFSLVIQEERQRGIGVSSGPIVPQFSESPGLVNASQSFGGRGRDMLFCTHCQKSNHTIDKCYQLHGFPPSFGRGRGRGFGGSGNSGVVPSNVQRSVHSVGAQLSIDGSSASQPTYPIHASSEIPSSSPSNLLSTE